MLNSLNIFKHLLPNARAWLITLDSQLRQFFDGLAKGLIDPIKLFFDQIWEDLQPQTTRELSTWETQFALPTTTLTEQERRDRLDATWKALGGQSPRYIEDTLQNAGFNVFVHEWWVPGSEPPIGSNAPATPRNPLDFINDSVVNLISVDGAIDMQDGGVTAIDGATFLPKGFLLVNKLLVLDAGVYVPRVYTIPADPTKYPYFLYIGGAVFPAQATVPTARKDEFETLCLKICPAQQWLGVLVTYV